MIPATRQGEAPRSQGGPPGQVSKAQQGQAPGSQGGPPGRVSKALGNRARPRLQIKTKTAGMWLGGSIPGKKYTNKHKKHPSWAAYWAGQQGWCCQGTVLLCYKESARHHALLTEENQHRHSTSTSWSETKVHAQGNCCPYDQRQAKGHEESRQEGSGTGTCTAWPTGGQLWGVSESTQEGPVTAAHPPAGSFDKGP